MDGDKASAIIRALIWGTQKARSNLTEALGDSDVAAGLLADLEPFLFGKTNVLPQLLDWQARIRETKVIHGRDLYNFIFLMDLKARSALMCAAANGYDIPDPDMTWVTQEWRIE